MFVSFYKTLPKSPQRDSSQTSLKQNQPTNQVCCCCLRALLLVSNDLLDSNSRLDSDHNLALTAVPSISDLIGHSLGESGKVEIRLLVPSFVHESHLTLLTNVNDLPLALVDNGDGGTVRRGNHIFVLLAGENVGGGEVALGVSVFSGLGDGDVEDFARETLDHHVSNIIVIVIIIMVSKRVCEKNHVRALYDLNQKETIMHTPRDHSLLFVYVASSAAAVQQQHKNVPSLLDLPSFHGNGSGGTRIGGFNMVIVV